MAHKDSKEGHLWLVGIALSTILTLVFVLACEWYFHEQTPTDQFFWLQMFSGSSWPAWELVSAAHPGWFAVAATVHVMLNIGPLLAIVWLIWTLVSARRKTMDLAHAFQLRDMELKLKIKNLIFEKLTAAERTAFSAHLDDIFDRATDDWKHSLTILVGGDVAERALKSLEASVN